MLPTTTALCIYPLIKEGLSEARDGALHEQNSHSRRTKSKSRCGDVKAYEVHHVQADLRGTGEDHEVEDDWVD